MSIVVIYVLLRAHPRILGLFGNEREQERFAEAEVGFVVTMRPQTGAERPEHLQRPTFSADARVSAGRLPRRPWS